MTTAPLLFEIGCEELPPAWVERMASELAQRITDGLDTAGVLRGDATVFASPRRLAVLVAAVASEQPEQHIEKRGPAVKAPAKAVEGFAKSCGVSVDALEQIETKKGTYYQYSGTEAGQALAEILSPLLEDALNKLTTPKRMRWGDGDAQFLRPVQWLVLLHGEAVLPFSMFGLDAGRETLGHRVHAPFPLELTSPDDYEMTLFEAQVIARFDQRRDIVRQQVTRAAEKAGGTARISTALLDEVTALVEWPVAISGSIDAHFMALPPEVLVTTIESHQRYFPVEDGNGGLLPKFITVTNIESMDSQRVIAGNERVVRPRLDDALFFWNKDRKQPLADYAPKLADVTFQKGLGSYADKAKRLVEIVHVLAKPCGADAAAAKRAAALAKADLVTDMVFEMTELEGIMGGYYARESGEDAKVADAIAAHYQPRGPSDEIPPTAEGRAVALADKLDALAGQFALGNTPTGDRDPLGLRRAALGMIRIVLESEISLPLGDALRIAAHAQPIDCDVDAVVEALNSFLADRLRGVLADSDIDTGVFNAITSTGIKDLLDTRRRAEAVAAFRGSAAAESLAAAHKRARNLLKKVDGAPGSVKAKQFTDDAERALFDKITEIESSVASKVNDKDYAAALELLGSLQAPVDQFFEDVMVMADDEAVRDNRLALLARLDGLCTSVADFSLL
ncbi:glycine--tRNA ligase subunit beta [bacterium]|nr:glycine--tRNA ligase subunit beta [bacterium]